MKHTFIKSIKLLGVGFICIVLFCFSYSNIAFANDLDIDNISGGVKIVDGIEYEMSAWEAQQQYLEEQKMENETLEGITYQNSINKINKGNLETVSPTAIGSLTLKSASLISGTNRRISIIKTNKTSSPMIETISGSETITASGTGQISGTIKLVNAQTSFTVSQTSKRSESTQVTIKPNEEFYMTFTPYLIRAVTKDWTNQYTVTMPRMISGRCDGNIYYITRRIGAGGGGSGGGTRSIEFPEASF